MGACPPAGSPPGQNDSRELSSGGRSRRPQLGNGAAAVASNLPHISDSHASKPKQEKWEKREIVLAPLFSVLLFDLLVRRQRGGGCPSSLRVDWSQRRKVALEREPPKHD